MATTTRDQGMGTGRSPAPPGPSEKPLLGTVLEMRREGPLGFYVRMWREYGDCFIHHVGRIPVYVFIHPNDVEYVVSEHEENFDKNTIIEQRARRVINQSLLMSDWHRWGHLRQVMA